MNIVLNGSKPASFTASLFEARGVSDATDDAHEADHNAVGTLLTISTRFLPSARVVPSGPALRQKASSRIGPPFIVRSCDPAPSIGLILLTWNSPEYFIAARTVACAILPSKHGLRPGRPDGQMRGMLSGRRLTSKSSPAESRRSRVEMRALHWPKRC
jgi:hypothetical protein